MVDIKQLLQDHNVPFTTEGKNTQRGWVNVCCPKCSDSSNHGGFNIQGGYYNCWQCGHTKLPEILSLLIGCSYPEARELIKEYDNAIEYTVERKTPKRKEIIFPKDTRELSELRPHRKYLERRNYDPEEIVRLWKVKGTGFLGSYKFRILIPIILNQKIVSYTARDITDRAQLRYKSCKIEEEVIHHKHICYGTDYVKYRRAIIVEGPMDVWRIGPGALSTFGTAFTPQQLIFLSTIIDEAFILYDREEQAQKDAQKLYYGLSGIINHVEIIEPPTYAKDPGQMKEKDAEDMRKFFLKY